MNVHTTPRVGDQKITKAEAMLALASVLLKWKDKIDAAMESAGNPFTFDQIVERVMIGKFHCYPYDNGLLLAEVLEFGEYKTYHVAIAVGDMEAVIAAEPDLERVARQFGCTRLSANGRVGWPRIAKKYGWKHLSSVITREL